MVVNSEARKLLADLGLSDYESTAYLSLLGCQPATAYELAKVSGIPSSKIYETTHRLVDKGLVEPVTADKERGQRYIALGAQDFIAAKREEVARKTASLEPLLRQAGNGREADFIWQLDAGEDVRDKAVQLLGEAEHSVLVSLWPQELEVLENELRVVEKRGVRLAVVHYGPPSLDLGATFHHPAEETVRRERGGRGLTLTVDSRCVVIATFFDDGRVEGAWSRNRAFVYVAEDFVRHDVYITKVTATMDPELKRRFGDDYAHLRDVFEPVEDSP